MNKISIDAFSETNPAFCSLIIFNFCRGFTSETKEGVPFPIVFLVLPVVLSNDLSKSFEGTNVKTGFFKWINSNPEILLGLTTRINESTEFFKPAIKYGLHKKILHINDSGYLVPIIENIKTSKKTQLDYLFKYAERLGNWMGQINSTKTIYNYLGIQV